MEYQILYQRRELLNRRVLGRVGQRSQFVPERLGRQALLRPDLASSSSDNGGSERNLKAFTPLAIVMQLAGGQQLADLIGKRQTGDDSPGLVFDVADVNIKFHRSLCRRVSSTGLSLYHSRPSRRFTSSSGLRSMLRTRRIPSRRPASSNSFDPSRNFRMRRSDGAQ